MPIRTVAQRALADWNRRVLTETDFYNCCRERKIIYIETELIEAMGVFLSYRGKDFILVHPHCKPDYKAWIMFHELGHALMHQPGNFSTTLHRKLDYEANVFATVALVPMSLLEKYSINEIQDFYDLPDELISYRLMVYQRLHL